MSEAAKCRSTSPAVRCTSLRAATASPSLHDPYTTPPPPYTVLTRILLQYRHDECTGETCVNDLLTLGTLALLAVLTWGLIVLCDRLRGGKDGA